MAICTRISRVLVLSHCLLSPNGLTCKEVHLVRHNRAEETHWEQGREACGGLPTPQGRGGQAKSIGGGEEVVEVWMEMDRDLDT